MSEWKEYWIEIQATQVGRALIAEESESLHTCVAEKWLWTGTLPKESEETAMGSETAPREEEPQHPSDQSSAVSEIAVRTEHSASI